MRAAASMRRGTCLVVAAVTCILLAGPLAGAAALPRDAAAQPPIATASRQQGEADRITSLPGVDWDLPSAHYAGYISVDDKAGRQLFYYLVEREASGTSHDADAPLVLWLNGGPGCSSFDGFVYEHGPFKFSWAPGASSRTLSALRLAPNPLGWQRAAHMLYVDSPAAVGLSYSGQPADYATNDTAVAADLDAFLRAFLARHARFQGRDFYIAGESYAGIYVPMAAAAVVAGNAQRKRPHINIQGYLVGNGCTDERFDGNAIVPFAAGKSLISTGLAAELARACRGNYWDVEEGSRCDRLLAAMADDLKDLNLYNILDDCHAVRHAGDPLVQRAPGAPAASGAAAGGQAAAAAAAAARAAALRSTHRGWPVGGGVRANSSVANWARLLGHNPPCTDASEAEAWLNAPQVRAALHAAPAALTGPWTICSDRIAYTSNGGSMLPVHAALTGKQGLRALIYSGDADLCVPHTGSEAWTRALHRRERTADGRPCAQLGGAAASASAARHECEGVARPWAPWHVQAGGLRQVAGYVVEYESGLSYATVKGAGHMVPESRPLEALAMFERFLAGQPLAGGGRSASPRQRPQPVAAS